MDVGGDGVEHVRHRNQRNEGDESVGKHLQDTLEPAFVIEVVVQITQAVRRQLIALQYLLNILCSLGGIRRGKQHADISGNGSAVRLIPLRGVFPDLCPDIFNLCIRQDQPQPAAVVIDRDAHRRRIRKRPDTHGQKLVGGSRHFRFVSPQGGGAEGQRAQAVVFKDLAGLVTLGG